MKSAHAFLIRTLGIFLIAASASAQDPADSVTVAVGDTLLPAFSPLSVRLPGMGHRAPSADTLTPFSGPLIQWSDAHATTQLFGRSADFFLWDLGEPGKNSQLLFRGVDWRSIGLSLDGVPLDDPIGAGFNLYDLPIEFIDRIEVVSSSTTMETPTPSPGAMINIVSPQYLSYRPVTKIRFMQGPYGQVFSDGLFTQNLARTTNLLVGFQRHATDGRFANALYDAWNLRSRVRFDVSDRFNVALTYLYTKRISQTNGGVYLDSTRTIFQGAGATVRYPEATETVWRHDAAVHVLTALFPDTAALTKATAYYTLHERDYRDAQSPVYSTPAVDRTHVGGLRLEQQIPLQRVDAAIGGEFQSKDVTASPHVGIRHEVMGSVWGRAAIDLFGFLQPRAHAREDFFEELRLVSYGAGVTLTAGSSLDLLFDASSSWRVPTMQERFWSTPLVTRLNQIVPEKHHVVEGTIRLRPWEGARLSLTGFRRDIDNGVVFVASSPADARTTGVAIVAIPRLSIQGVTLDAMLPIWKLGIHLTGGFSEYTEQDTIKTLLPKWRGVLDVFFRDSFFGDHLDLKVGVRMQGNSGHRGMEFVPPMLAYVENRGQDVGRYASMDLYGIFHIGDAFVTLVWENFLNIDYYITPVYPMLDRNITLGINWRFLD